MSSIISEVQEEADFDSIGARRLPDLPIDRGHKACVTPDVRPHTVRASYSLPGCIHRGSSNDAGWLNTQATSRMHRRAARQCSAVRVVCSGEADRFTFSNADFAVLPDAVRPETYGFSAEGRRLARADLGPGESGRPIGTTKRLAEKKNQVHLIRRVTEFCSKGDEVSLLIVEDGPLRNIFEELAVSPDTASCVFLVGATDNVVTLVTYLSAFDLFTFLSPFEGFGMAALEAQLYDLSCVASENVSLSVDVSTDIRHILLADEAAWGGAQICMSRYDVCLTAATRRHDIYKQRIQLLSFLEGHLQASVDRLARIRL